MTTQPLNVLGDWADQWAPAIWRASWQGGLFILAVWAVTRTFRRMPANARYWMWWVASLQMVLRLAFVAPISLPLLPAEPESSAAPIPFAFVTEPPREPAFSMEFIEPFVTPLDPAPVTVVTAAEPTSSIDPNLVLFGLWGLALTGCAVYSACRFWRARRLLAHATPIAQEEVLEWMAARCAESKMHAPRLRESESAQCPMLSGWWRPTIVLPLGYADTEKPSTVRMALAHELAHLKRRDLWLGIVPALTQSLFVFHPLAWLAAHETAAAREEACDMDALSMSGGSPAAYARLLLNSAQASSSVAALGAAFGYRLLHRRIQMLNRSLRSDVPRYRRASAAVLAVGLICALPWTVTAQTSKASGSSKPNSAKTTKKSAPVPQKTKASGSKATSSPTKAALAPLATTTAAKGQPAQAAIAESRTMPAKAAIAITGAAIVTPASAINVKATMPDKLAVAPAAIGTKNIGGKTAIAYPAQMAPTQAAQETRAVDATVSKTAPGDGFGGNGVAKTASDDTNGGFGGGGFSGGGFTGGGFGQVVATVPGPKTFPLMQVTCLQGAGTTAAHLNVHFRGVDLRSAISEVMEAAGLNYVIQSNVMDETVTCNLNNVSFDEAIKAVLGSVQQKLTYRRDGSVFYFKVNVDNTIREK